MNDNGKKSKKSKKKKLYTICMIILICIFVGSAVYLGAYFFMTKKSEDKFKDLKALITDDTSNDKESDNSDATSSDAAKTEYVTVDGVSVQKKFRALYSGNKDFIGWLTIEGTDIDYPVMQTPDDEEYYLHRDYDKNYSYPGTLFADTSSDISKPSDNIIIYGHHMQSGKMFGKLEDFADKDFTEKHKYITFDTIYGDGTYEVIAAFYSKIYDKDYMGFKYYQFFDAADEEQFDDFVDNCKSLTAYDIDATAAYGDKLITLSTCAYHTENGRFVVVAKKIN